MPVRKRLVYRGRYRACLTATRRLLLRLVGLKDVNPLSPLLTDAQRASANQLAQDLAMKLTLKL